MATDVYVMEPYLQNGGTYMAYQLGRICHNRFGCRIVAVGSACRPNSYFHYANRFPVISVPEMERRIGDRDLLICNPSFSTYLFGLRVPGRKLCYVQHATSFQVLDCFFDCYVFVSKFVRDFVTTMYGLTGPIVNAFIDTDLFKGGTSWSARSDTVMVLGHKGVTLPLLERLKSIYKKKFPVPNVSFEIFQGISQQELAYQMGNHKYYLTLTPIEGFGLPSLEAMASGCAVVGFHGFGGSEYFRHRVNCVVAKYPNLEEVADLLFEVINDQKLAERLSAVAANDAKQFDWTRFESSWTPILRQLI